MRFDLLVWEQILPDPENNARQFFSEDGIEDLADSIHEFGLLENLVVREGNEENTYFLVAGERRHRAIKVLIDRDIAPKDFRIPTLIIDGDGSFESLVENIGRIDVPPWELGRKFASLVEGGHTQAEIGARLGKPQGYISRNIQVARGLHPKVIARLNLVGPGRVSMNDLIKLATVKDQFESPDEKAQMNLLEKFLGAKKTRKRRPAKASNVEKTMRRLAHLRHQMIVPLHARPYVEVIASYLLGEVKGRAIEWPEEL